MQGLAKYSEVELLRDGRRWKSAPFDRKTGTILSRQFAVWVRIPSTAVSLQ